MTFVRIFELTQTKTHKSVKYLFTPLVYQGIVVKKQSLHDTYCKKNTLKLVCEVVPFEIKIGETFWKKKGVQNTRVAIHVTF